MIMMKSNPTVDELDEKTNMDVSRLNYDCDETIATSEHENRNGSNSKCVVMLRFVIRKINKITVVLNYVLDNPSNYKIAHLINWINLSIVFMNVYFSKLKKTFNVR